MKPDPSTHDPRPEYLAELLASTGMHKRDVAKYVLGCDLRTLDRYLSGERKIPYGVQFLLESQVLSV